MPTYEKRDAEGNLLERTITLAGHPSGYDEQMVAVAADDATPWHLAENFPADDHRVASAVATGQLPAPSATVPPPFAHDDLKTEEV